MVRCTPSIEAIASRKLRSSHAALENTDCALQVAGPEAKHVDESIEYRARAIYFSKAAKLLRSPMMTWSPPATSDFYHSSLGRERLPPGDRDRNAPLRVVEARCGEFGLQVLAQMYRAGKAVFRKGRVK